MKAQSIRRIPLLISLLAVAAAAFASPASAERDKPKSLKDRYIVVLKDSVERPGQVAERHSDNRDAAIKQVYRHSVKGYAATISKGDLAAVKADPNVAYVEHDGRGSTAAQNVPTGIDRVSATANEALQINEEDDLRVDANVAVLDTGIAEHPDLDLVGHINCNEQPCAEGGTDGYRHGTHVAGTIGAIDNDFGVVGVAPGVRLWGIKVFNDGGSGWLSDLIAGIDWITATREDEDPENDIHVANASLYFPGVESSQAFDEAIEVSVEAGIVHVVCAGNKAQAVSYIPGNNPEVITVAALQDLDGKPGQAGKGKDPLAPFSNYGSAIDVAAPGVAILSTVLDGGYKKEGGTSMAAPHVAGAAAIFAAEDTPESKADVEEIREAILKQGSFDWEDNSFDGIHEPLLDVGSGFGWPPLPGAVTQDASTVAPLKATLNATVNPRGLDATYQFEYGETAQYGTKVPASPQSVGTGTSPVKVNESIEGLEPGTTYHFRVVATSDEGASYGKDHQFKTTLEPPIASFVSSFGEYGATPGKLTLPGAIAIDAEGDVWVAEPYSNRVQKFNSEGEYLSQVGGLALPTGIAIDAEGDLWVAEPLNNRVRQFNSEGEYLSQFGELGFPTGVTIDAQGDVWVTDGPNDRVQRFNQQGESLGQFGETGAGNGQLRGPMGIAIDAQGDVWVADLANSRVQQFNSEGEYLSQIGEAGTGNGQLDEPTDIAFDSFGDIWVTDTANNRVQRFSQGGAYLGRFGEEGSFAGQFREPRGIAFDADGDIWVSDADNDRVQKWVRAANSPAVVTEEGALEAGTQVHAISEDFTIWLGSEYPTHCDAVHVTGKVALRPNGDQVLQETEGEGEECDIDVTKLGLGKFPATVDRIALGTVKFFEGGTGSLSSLEVDLDVPALGVTCSWADPASSTWSQAGGAAFGGGGFGFVQQLSAEGEGCQGAKAEAEFELFTGKETPVFVNKEGKSPIAVTRAANEITKDSAALNAIVNPSGLSTDYRFEWADQEEFEAEEYGHQIPAEDVAIGSANSYVEVSQELEGLQQGATYHFRVVATNEEGTSYGKDRQFTASANVSLDTEEGTLEAGTPIHAISEDFTIWVGPNVAMGPYPLTCDSVQVSGKVAPAPGSANGQVIEEAEGSGEDCQFDATKLSMGKLPAKVDPVSLGTIEFDEGGTGSLSSFEGDFDVAALGLACSWAGETADTTWSQEGGSAFGGGGFGFDQQLSAEGEGCAGAKAEAEFELFTGEETPVFVNEEE